MPTFESKGSTRNSMHSDSENVWEHQKRLKVELDAAREAGETGTVTMSSLKSAHLGATIGMTGLRPPLDFPPCWAP
jgi:hypothetical protein